MVQKWRDLLFAHWSLEPSTLQATLPPGLTIDTFDGRAWLGIVPFFMRGIRPVYLPPVPGISNFLKLNVRTYVTDESGRPGVWFYSLDADQWLAVKIARGAFKLPYFRAKMSARRHADGRIDYACGRRGETNRATCQWTPHGTPFKAAPGSLDFFLAERYLLYSWNPKRRQLYSGRVVHPPYPLRRVDVYEISTLPVCWDGLGEITSPPEHVIASDGVNVDVFPIRRVE